MPAPWLTSRLGRQSSEPRRYGLGLPASVKVPMQLSSPTPGRMFSLALALTALIAPLAVHIFLPVIPAGKAELALTDAQAQFAFSIALFTMAFATLVYGTLSDRLGRR